LRTPQIELEDIICDISDLDEEAEEEPEHQDDNEETKELGKLLKRATSTLREDLRVRG